MTRKILLLMIIPVTLLASSCNTTSNQSIMPSHPQMDSNIGPGDGAAGGGGSGGAGGG